MTCAHEPFRWPPCTNRAGSPVEFLASVGGVRPLAFVSLHVCRHCRSVYMDETGLRGMLERLQQAGAPAEPVNVATLIDALGSAADAIDHLLQLPVSGPGTKVMHAIGARELADLMATLSLLRSIERHTIGPLLDRTNRTPDEPPTGVGS